MIKKNTLLILLVLLLGGLSFYINRDRFGVEPVQVSDRSMQPRGAGLRQAGDSAANLVVFLFSRELSLTNILVRSGNWLPIPVPLRSKISSTA